MKKKVLIDIKIICEEPSHISRWCRTEEERLGKVEMWVKEFHDFIRDHRSQDPVFLNVERVYEERCSFCGYQWEEEENGQPYCCDLAIEEWMEGRLGELCQNSK